jgi:hypothetical protein
MTMSDELHDLLKHFANVTETDNFADMEDAAVLEFCRYSPAKRTEVLGRLSVNVGEDCDGITPSLRKTSQVCKLHSDLQQVHAKLKRAGR